ncbi:hypothetical protein PIB30_011507 [Stylosanthes scabra]|uniref:Uncharacterized protein n=1 Tax=Stylosanthes scabra TaxID=79078 RepID=A0ABU6S6B6_9FABA|nr:hypothetical protein [Stylosanthes scabra]
MNQEIQPQFSFSAWFSRVPPVFHHSNYALREPFRKCKPSYLLKHVFEKPLRLSKTVPFHFHFKQNQIIFILQQKNIIGEKSQRSTRTKRSSSRFEHEEEELNKTYELTNLQNGKDLQTNSKNRLRRTQQLKKSGKEGKGKNDIKSKK